MHGGERASSTHQQVAGHKHQDAAAGRRLRVARVNLSSSQGVCVSSEAV